MITIKKLGFFIFLIVLTGNGCETIFGSKNDDTNEEIFEEGRIDPQLENLDGYAPITPFWGDFDAPNDVHVGFDTFVYVTDNEGVHLLDRADLSPRRTIQLDGANAVTQDRLLNVYVSARIDTTIDKNGVPTTFNLPAIFKIKNMNGTGDLEFVDTLIFPFDDASLSTDAAQNARLNKGSANNYENVQITGLSILADNSLYATRRGPQNNTNQIAAPDNTVLEFSRIEEGGVPTKKMVNVRQITTLNPSNPSLRSAVGLSSISTFVTPPQRDRLTDDRSFLITQASQSQPIDFRVLWINAVVTTDGLIFEQNSSLLAQDTSQANGFLYEPGKFQLPADITFSGDDDAYIFVIDSEKDSLFQFQSNGQEGVNPPAGADADSKKIIVSFGGNGTGPKQFNNPQGVAYYRTIVYVADTGNNRIARFKLTTDFE
jgi:hypothetical protein